MSSENTNSNADDFFDAEIHHVCAILEQLASKFSLSQEEHEALEQAALAFTAVKQSDRIMRNYLRLRVASGGAISPALKEKLKRQGIDADELERELDN